MKRLSDMEIGEEGRIARIGKDVSRKLFDMGLTRGTKVKVIRKAPLGDPVEIEVRGYFLSLRKEEAEEVEIEQ